MRTKRSFYFSLLGAGSVLALSANLTAVQAQEESDDDTDVIVVRGVRGAQEASINIKRNSTEVVDAIVAEDIGKLPDTTISDALQRVTGIQIGRRAGEGADVSIRGSSNVLATLNGERFITAESLLTPSADFQDVPASLVTGVNVYKSQTASQVDGGTGGIIDLRTLRSLTLDDGFTASGSVRGGWGSIADGVDQSYEGLLGYNFGNGVAMSLTASYSDATLASSFQETEPDFVDEFSTWICPSGCGDLNGDGDTVDEFITPIGWNSFVNNREFERERLGLAYNFNAELSDSWEFVADVLYNEMTEIEHGQQLYVNGNFASRGGFGAYTDATGNPSVTAFGDASDQTNRSSRLLAMTAYRTGLRGGVNSFTRETEALNSNFELNYDNGGSLTGSLRFVHGSADRKRSSIILAQQTSQRCLPLTPAQANDGECTEVNPGGIATDLVYPYSVMLGKDALGFSIDEPLASLAADPAAWYLHSNWLETNFTDASQNILRGDGSYEFDNSMFSIDFGVRYAGRETEEERADYFSPSGIDGLLNKFGEVGYAVGQTVGVAADYDYDPLPFFQIDGPELSPFVTTVDDFGSVPGLNVNLPFIDTRAIAGDFEGFRDMLYGPGQYIAAPDRSYKVEEEQLTAYIQTNFDTPINALVNLSGNVGVRIVNTETTVTQNSVEGDQLRQDILAGVDPNHSAYLDLGDVVTTTDRTVALPSINLNFDVGTEHRFKLAYQETQAQQPFENLGRGEITFYQGNTDDQGNLLPYQEVSSRQRLGNPELDPTRQRSMSAAWEWYPRENALISAGAFYNEVESYTFNDQSEIILPDSDGVVRADEPGRGPATLLEIANGEGANYYGFEFAYQQTFDFLPWLLQYTGTTLNYTYSPSQSGINAATGEEQILADGSDAPLNSTAEHQWNAIVFYQDDRFQARIAANYLSEQYTGAFTHWSFSPNQGVGLGQYNEETLFVDFGASYDVSENIQVFLNGSNLTEEAPVSYRGWDDNRWSWNQWERTITAGVRGRF